MVSRVTQCLSDDFEVFRKRDLSSEELLYLELDRSCATTREQRRKSPSSLPRLSY